MREARPVIGGVQFLLLAPALLFMAALVARQLTALPFDAAAQAQRIVMRYAARTWSLWLLLILLPMAAFISGGVTLLSSRASMAIATATATAAGILGVVVLHMLAN